MKNDKMKKGVLYLRENKDRETGENLQYWFGRISLDFGGIGFEEVEIQLTMKELDKFIKRAESNPEDFKGTNPFIDLLKSYIKNKL